MNNIKGIIEEKADDYVRSGKDAETVVLDTYTYATLLEETGLDFLDPLFDIYIEAFDKSLIIEVDAEAEELVSFI
tara:strand:+ start:3660 stop:3884 length:225 start_codon:yes stop_codon:yes gene_type:complete